MTTQKLKILEYLNNYKDHPNAETIYKEVKKQLPAITLATVYRNLNLLAEQGKITRFKIGNEYRFDGRSECHQHLICIKCGKITDICNKQVSDYALNNLKTPEFTPESVSIKLYGLCKSCRGDKNVQKNKRDD